MVKLYPDPGKPPSDAGGRSVFVLGFLELTLTLVRDDSSKFKLPMRSLQEVNPKFIEKSITVNR